MEAPNRIEIAKTVAAAEVVVEGAADAAAGRGTARGMAVTIAPETTETTHATALPGTTVPGTTVPGTTVPGTTGRTEVANAALRCRVTSSCDPRPFQAGSRTAAVRID